MDRNVDEDCLYNFPRGIIRIEYPGRVENVSKAIDTLGGYTELQGAIANPTHKLQLKFHSENPYNKPVIAERDTNPGILIRAQELTKKDNQKEIRYDVVGVTSPNFKFTKLCDFQYLPVVEKEDTDDDDYVDFVLPKIIPNTLPNLNWFLSKDTVNQTRFTTPHNFARLDIPCNHLYLDTGEKYTLDAKEGTNKEKKIKSMFKNYTISITFGPNVEIPTGPLPEVKEILETPGYEEKCRTLSEFFEERPIWSREAIQSITGFKNNILRTTLPAVGYYCLSAPWKFTWIRFGYDPTKDFEARIYQILDFRIRNNEGLMIKIQTKRDINRKMLSMNERMGDRRYILKPNYIPPARQMFYHYCDIHLPEIQDMLRRLPKPPYIKYDTKNGWLPITFADQCREILKGYVMTNVQKAFQEDSMRTQNIVASDAVVVEEDEVKQQPAAYCSKMLSNIKSGVYKSSTDVFPLAEFEDSTDVINLTEDTNQEIDLDYAVNSIPEKITGNSDDEDDDDDSISSMADIDLEAVAEINKIIRGDT